MSDIPRREKHPRFHKVQGKCKDCGDHFTAENDNRVRCNKCRQIK